MNAKQFIILLTVTFLSLLTISSFMFHDDFQEGWRAYVKKDYETAHRLWLPLGEQENSRAQFFMGFMYDFGFGVQEDDKEAVKWYRLAAEQGYRFTELNTIIHDSANMNVPKQFKNWLDKIISAKIRWQEGPPLASIKK